jgi:hypothetical protein
MDFGLKERKTLKKKIVHRPMERWKKQERCNAATKEDGWTPRSSSSQAIVRKIVDADQKGWKETGKSFTAQQC